MAFESFVGVLFASITGAIIFSKIARIQSIAPVVFSDPLVVRYGCGLQEKGEEEENGKQHYHEDKSGEDQTGECEKLSRSTASNTLEIPCPILEFRVINTLWKQRDGEIMDATVNVMVSRLESASEVSESGSKDQEKLSRNEKLQQQQITKRKQKHRPRPQMRSAPLTVATNRALTTNQASLLHRASVAATRTSRSNSGSLIQRVNNSSISTATMAALTLFTSLTLNQQMDDKNKEGAEPFNMAQEEEAAAAALRMIRQEAPADIVTFDEGLCNVCPRSIFQPLAVETDRHPFFKRVWVIRHECNELSPLLPNHVRRQIQENNGYWPPKLNRCDAVRRAINFQEIIVSFSGIANDSGSAVYAQKVYSYVDMVVGYTFANILFQDLDGEVIVDTGLLNDVKEQKGGGREPIQTQDDPNFWGYTSSPVISMPGEPVMTDPIVEATREEEEEETGQEVNNVEPNGDDDGEGDSDDILVPH